VLALPPHRSLLRRGPDARQFGLDPRTALAVDDLSPPLALMLDELRAPSCPQARLDLWTAVDAAARSAARG